MSVTSTAPRRRRVTTAAVLTGLVGSSALALSMGTTLSAFTATITNTANTAASATLAVEETSGNATCRSFETTTNCATINKYGGTGSPMIPGGTPQTTTVSFKSVGTAPVGSANLVPAACEARSTGATGSTTPGASNTDANNLCSVLNVAIYKGTSATGNALYNGKASGLNAQINLSTTIAKDASQAFTFVVSLPQEAPNTVQGQQVSQPLTWNFNQ